MTEQLFWNLIDASWEDSPEINALRTEALKTNDEGQLSKLSEKLEDIILENYTRRLHSLSKEDLTKFIHILEERLYHIDRQEIHEYVDGSDDGFLYARCFILGMGKAYYSMVDQTPSKATFDLWAEGFGFSAYGVYEEKCGEEFERYTFHSIETCSNEEGWAVE
jgi:hypothetical protein